MSADYNDKKEQFNKLLKEKKPNTPMQGVVAPIELTPAAKAKPEKIEVHVNFWIDADLMDEVKLYALRSKKTIKQIGREALELYLQSNAK